MVTHKLHQQIGKIIKEKFNNNNYTVLLDSACGGKQSIPLFGSEIKSNKTEYCNVDLLILKDDRIKVIIEIEESDIKPVHIFGKFLVSALSTHYIHDSKKCAMDQSVAFIQVVDTSKLGINKTSKFEQCKNIGLSIQKILHMKWSNIGEYKIFNDKELDKMLAYLSTYLG